jgi:hypothetical protein
VQFSLFFFNSGAPLLIYSLFGTNEKKKLYRIVDYPLLYPDVSGDAGSIPPPLPPMINAEADVEATPSGATASLNTSDSGPPGSNAHEMQELVDVCRAFLVQIQQGAAPWLVQRLNRLNQIYGPMPTDPAQFSYWMAMVSISFL